MFERSFHFIPANRPSFFENTSRLPADALIFDLEDAVPTASKSEAIRFLKSRLSGIETHRLLFARVNGLGQPWFDEERELFNSFPDLGLVLPKTGMPDRAAEAIDRYLGADNRAVVLLVEDPSTLPYLRELTQVPGVKGLGLGFEDFLSGMVLPRADLPDFVAQIRGEVAIHCAAAGISAIDSISLDLTGGQSLECQAVAARSAGMTAMFSIHPVQIPVINRNFSPRNAEIAEARRIVALAGDLGESAGYRSVDGTLLSPPKIRKAHTILEFANRHEL